MRVCDRAMWRLALSYKTRTLSAITTETNASLTIYAILHYHLDSDSQIHTQYKLKWMEKEKTRHKKFSWVHLRLSSLKALIVWERQKFVGKFTCYLILVVVNTNSFVNKLYSSWSYLKKKVGRKNSSQCAILVRFIVIFCEIILL